jgi:hypothetical protein
MGTDPTQNERDDGIVLPEGGCLAFLFVPVHWLGKVFAKIFLFIIPIIGLSLYEFAKDQFKKGQALLSLMETLIICLVIVFMVVGTIYLEVLVKKHHTKDGLEYLYVGFAVLLSPLALYLVLRLM